jgi:hypothetical protein
MNRPPAREQSENQRVMSENILPEDLPGVGVELEHRRIELQDIFGPDFGRARRFGSDDLFEVGRQIVRASGPARSGERQQ